MTDNDDPLGLWARPKQSSTHRGTSGRSRFVPMPATSGTPQKN